MSVRRAVAGIGVAITAAVAYVLACGPFVEEIPTVAVVEPANLAAYARGELGVVRPRLARRYLVQAYRVLSGRPPLTPAALGSNPAAAAAPATSGVTSPEAAWSELNVRIFGGAAPVGQRKRVPGSPYQDFLNCPDSAFDSAVRTLRARIERYGERAAPTVAWARAQRTVFANCESPAPAIPEPLAAGADPSARADRDYQIAVAQFYAMRYQEAARSFRAIAGDRASPWRIHGRYLAARAAIRSATIPDRTTPEQQARARQLLESAEADLAAVLADASATPVHPWARQLRDYVAARIHPIEQLHALSRSLAASVEPTAHDVEDYRWLLDSLVGDTIEYAYESIPRLAEMIDGDDLTDWILAMQGGGDAATERAVTRWQASGAAPWLVAALWRLPVGHPAAAAALDAAERIDRASPAYATVGFLRVRLLARAGRRDEARRVLAALPSDPAVSDNRSSSEIASETMNLLRAERVMLADDLHEFLAHAPRVAVMNDRARERRGAPPGSSSALDAPVFGDDAAVALNDWFPLDQLVDAAVAPELPPRLRARVANTALSRAIVLGREDAGLRVAPVLAELAPPLRSDIDRYTHAPTADQRRAAGLFLLLRTPGMHVVLQTPDDNYSYRVTDPDRDFDRLLHRNLWCGLDQRLDGGKRGDSHSELVGLVYPGARVPPPAFISVEQQSAAEREMRELAAAGAMRSYLGAEAVKWAREMRRDVDVAEALALAVQLWHFGCGDDEKWDIARQAFTLLHRQYPESGAAKRTKYWYK